MTLKYDDKRLESLAHISLENSRIVLTHPILFLCGGQVDVRSVVPISVRGALVEYLHKAQCHLADSITLAEEFKDWIHDSIYKDLLAFESDIAHISSLIVIILESPGALAELGLFVKNKALKNKILVFVRQDHYEESSFIKLGPLRYLQGVKESSVCAYPWNNDDLAGSLSSSLKEMREDILGAISSRGGSEAFNLDNEGHIAFVIYEVVKVFRALKFMEIEAYLQAIGISISRDKLKRLLFLLGKFKLIGSSTRGHVDYYYATLDVVMVEFAGKFESTKVKLAAQQYYATNDGESKRMHVIQSAYAIAAPQPVVLPAGAE
ncbi:retron St85 family effector protein [Pseudomonas protegens]|uniref:retron St85 family effector protein n=1 Tax=Pseudomonas protegens TaxID=380021 RepID=UPI00216010A1|nr:retron St85 family effector protein [Pseudomonas protegens]UVM13308.1 retron St85 family effector protein [Pseudomonas protegens]